ncbi:hypothetical protein MJT46_015412 [Ovis ammon polii x Ovis aries]|nr:hypothetical protein MJT46_015412 [Ovis ammon polii x Ovis aries]
MTAPLPLEPVPHTGSRLHPPQPETARVQQRRPSTAKFPNTLHLRHSPSSATQSLHQEKPGKSKMLLQRLTTPGKATRKTGSTDEEQPRHVYGGTDQPQPRHAANPGDAKPGGRGLPSGEERLGRGIAHPVLNTRSWRGSCRLGAPESSPPWTGVTYGSG